MRSLLDTVLYGVLGVLILSSSGCYRAVSFDPPPPAALPSRYEAEKTIRRIIEGLHPEFAPDSVEITDEYLRTFRDEPSKRFRNQTETAYWEDTEILYHRKNLHYLVQLRWREQRVRVFLPVSHREDAEALVTAFYAMKSYARREGESEDAPAK